MKIKLCDVSNCVFCASCAYVCPKNCISFSEDKGVLYPIIDASKCIKCKRCISACPQLTSGLKDRYNISNTPKIFASWALDEEIRRTSSSGGLFYVISRYVIEEQGIVFGAAYVNSMSIKHIAIDNINDLKRLQGSKYAQSDISDVYLAIQEYITQNKHILFTGTPCQVAAIKRVFGNYDKLVLVDIVCHGVPAITTFHKYIDKIGIKRTEKDVFQFRDISYWGFKLKYNSKKISVWNQYYLRAYKKNLIHINSCYQCNYSNLQRIGDITIGDFWDIGSVKVFNHKTDYGVSLLIVNNKKGLRVIDKIKKDLFLEIRDIDEATYSNSNLRCPSNRPLYREQFLKDFSSLSPLALQVKYKLLPTYKDILRPYKNAILRTINSLKK